MARKSRKKAEPKVEPAKIVRQVTPAKDVQTLVRRCKGQKKQIDEGVGVLREMIANAVEKKFLHKGAFAMARKLDNMEPEKLAEFFDHFDHYVDSLGLRARAESAPSLDLAEPAGDEPVEDDEAEIEDEKVARPSFGKDAAAIG